MSLAVAGDQLGIVEVVAGEHDDAFRQPVAQQHLLAGIEQRNLYALDLAGMALDDGDDRVERRLEIVAAPIAFQCRIEHVAQPVQDDLAGGLCEDAVVDAG